MIFPALNFSMFWKICFTSKLESLTTNISLRNTTPCSSSQLGCLMFCGRNWRFLADFGISCSFCWVSSIFHYVYYVTIFNNWFRCFGYWHNALINVIPRSPNNDLEALKILLRNCLNSLLSDGFISSLRLCKIFWLAWLKIGNVSVVLAFNYTSFA